MLADGRLHVSGIAVFVPILTRENRDRLLSRAVHKTKREIERLVAEVCPQPDAPSEMRKLPERPVSSTPAKPSVELFPGTAPDSLPALVADPASRPTPAPFPLVEPLSPSRYRIQFTAGEELHDDLERLRALLRSEVADGDLAAIVGKAVRELRQRLEVRRFAQTRAPRKTIATTNTAPSSRHVPAAVRRAVYGRERSQCCFVDEEGRRCPERHQVEYHHREAFGKGGGHEYENIWLLCEAQNRYLAEIEYGEDVIAGYILRSRTGRGRGAEDGGPTVPGISPAK
jgi:hypothetical protein